jgi:hypothetical protein
MREKAAMVYPVPRVSELGHVIYSQKCSATIV